MCTSSHSPNRDAVWAASAIFGESSESGARSALEGDLLVVAEPRDGRGADRLESLGPCSGSVPLWSVRRSSQRPMRHDASNPLNRSGSSGCAMPIARSVSAKWPVTNQFIPQTDKEECDRDPPGYIGGDPYLNTGIKFERLNPAAFAEVPDGGGAALVQPGNAGKGALRGPPFWNIEFVVSKRPDGDFRPTVPGGDVQRPEPCQSGHPRVDITRGDCGQIRDVSAARAMQLPLGYSSEWSCADLLGSSGPGRSLPVKKGRQRHGLAVTGNHAWEAPNDRKPIAPCL